MSTMNNSTYLQHQQCFPLQKQTCRHRATYTSFSLLEGLRTTISSICTEQRVLLALNQCLYYHETERKIKRTIRY